MSVKGTSSNQDSVLGKSHFDHVEKSLHSYRVSYSSISRYLTGLKGLPVPNGPTDNLTLFNQAHTIQMVMQSKSQTGLGPLSEKVSALWNAFWSLGKDCTSSQTKIQQQLQELKEKASAGVTSEVIISDFDEFLNDVQFLNDTNAQDKVKEFSETKKTIKNIAQCSSPDFTSLKKLEAIQYLKDTISEVSSKVLQETSGGNYTTNSSRKQFQDVTEALFSNIRKYSNFRTGNNFDPSKISVKALSTPISTFLSQDQCVTKSISSFTKKLNEESKKWPTNLGTADRAAIKEKLSKLTSDYIRFAEIATPAVDARESSAPRPSEFGNFVEYTSKAEGAAPTNAAKQESFSEKFGKLFAQSIFAAKRMQTFSSIKYVLNSDYVKPEQKQAVLNDMESLFAKAKQVPTTKLRGLRRGIENDIDVLTRPNKSSPLSTRENLANEIRQVINKHLKEADSSLSID